jgi:hypothetical protein
VTNYFAPEPGAAAVRLTRLARRLREWDHEITVLTSLPHYPQGCIHPSHRGKAVVTTELDGIQVVQTWLLATANPRISRKLPSQLSFMAGALLFGLRIPRPDAVLVEAQPVFTTIAGVLLALLKRCPYILNVSDLGPDHLLSVGAITDTHPLYRGWSTSPIAGRSGSSPLVPAGRRQSRRTLVAMRTRSALSTTELTSSAFGLASTSPSSAGSMVWARSSFVGDLLDAVRLRCDAGGSGAFRPARRCADSVHRARQPGDEAAGPTRPLLEAHLARG